MRELPSCSVDAIVTDPPYGLEFLGKDWDYGVPGPVYWQEALRVAKPGAHLLAFGGTRTFHRLACNIEDAGWEIRDCLLWLYSGFPKGTNLEKAISKTDPELGKEWHGFNTQLKPGYEPIIMGRKPTKDSLVRNVMEWGVGGLNVEGCKVGSEVVSYGPKKSVDSHAFEPKEGKHVIKRSGFAGSTHVGRWPTNVIMDEGVAADLDREVGRSVSRYYYCYKAGGEERQESNHPTLKPVALMRYLCKLVVPPGGLVLDPFCGSGSTLVAAKAERLHYIGMDIMHEYIAIAEKRLVTKGRLDEKRLVQANLDMW
jgi:site-specific DNA-methyltransferase (adenine-specific)